MTDEIALDDLPQPSFEGAVAPDDLHTDGDNPNEMTDEQFGLLCDRMQQRGWVGNAIVTNTDGCIADGEHRWEAAKEIGLSEVPVKQYSLTDSQRRLLRQELNKIKGEHDRGRDAFEFDRMLSDGLAGEVEELVETTNDDLESLLNDLDPGTGEYDGSADAANDPAEEWDRSGTAADTNEDLTAEHTVKVKLRNDDDLKSFEDLVGQEVKPENKMTIWYPEAEELTGADKEAVAADD